VADARQRREDEGAFTYGWCTELHVPRTIMDGFERGGAVLVLFGGSVCVGKRTACEGSCVLANGQRVDVGGRAGGGFSHYGRS
jgi:hypothetical protein